jgi:ATP-dependent protease HslVU (ClpYQ) peptidase subunit
MAADSQSNYGDCRVPGASQKLFRLRDGSVAGVAGSEGAWRRLLAWVDGDRVDQQPASDPPGTVIVLRRNGGIEVFEDGYFYTEPAPFMAWGSGQPVALGALHAGCSAAEAVRIACLVDVKSGGPVQSMEPQ